MIREDESAHGHGDKYFVRWFLKFMSKMSQRFLQLKMNVFICFMSDKSTYFISEID